MEVCAERKGMSEGVEKRSKESGEVIKGVEDYRTSGEEGYG